MNLIASHRGHFLLESGFHGDLWLDLDALFWRPAALTPLVQELAERVRYLEPDVVCGPLLGGALVAYRVAEMLDVPFLSAARQENDRGALFSARYWLPPTMQPRLNDLRVVVIDDVINAGSAVRSTVAALRASGSNPVGVAALLRLGDAVLTYADSECLPVESLTVRSNTVWPPQECPLCLKGLPLRNPEPSSGSAPG